MTSPDPLDVALRDAVRRLIAAYTETTQTPDTDNNDNEETDQ